MPETTGPSLSPVAASFARRMRAFHQSLPADEQKLLERVFALAEAGSERSGDVEGYGQGSTADPELRSLVASGLTGIWTRDVT